MLPYIQRHSYTSCTNLTQMRVAAAQLWVSCVFVVGCTGMPLTQAVEVSILKALFSVVSQLWSSLLPYWLSHGSCLLQAYIAISSRRGFSRFFTLRKAGEGGASKTLNLSPAADHAAGIVDMDGWTLCTSSVTKTLRAVRDGSFSSKPCPLVGQLTNAPWHLGTSQTVNGYQRGMQYRHMDVSCSSQGLHVSLAMQVAYAKCLAG